MQKTLHSLIQETQETLSRLIIDLFKLYQNNNKKYTRELYNILNIKLRVFYDCYKKVRL
jgi:hypothetical protein